jgi:arabinofuranan 3-O-arabinosyltransferase
MLATAQALSLVGVRLHAMKVPRLLAPVLLTSLVILVTAPAIVGGMALPGGYTAIPAHWYQTAAWLDHRSGPGTVLVVPASSFADFTWGSTKDEPLQALMRRPMAVRDALPLGSAGSTRQLDEIERRLGQGLGGPELHALLVRAGVRYVVVRDDLRQNAQGDPLIALHQSLAESGISRVADFGPPSGSASESPTFTVDERTFVPYPSVEIFDVGAIQGVSVVPRSRLVTATAGPEDVGGLAALYGVDGAAVLGSDVLGHDDLLAAAPHVLTDGQRRREVFFGRATHNTSPVLVAGDPGGQRRRALDYISDPTAGVTTLQWAGVSGVQASSSASDANAGLRLGTAYSPEAAVDGDPGTRWVSGNFGEATGEWLEVTFSKQVDLRRIGLQLSGQTPVGAAPRTVAVTTDRGTRTATVVGSGAEQVVQTPAGRTSRVRVTLTAVSAGPVNGFSIADLSIPGVTPVASLRLPPSSEATVDAIVLRDQMPGRSSCLHVGDHPLCRESAAVLSEEASGLRRLFSLPAGRSFKFSGEVLPRDGAALEKLMTNPFAISASASSRAVNAPEGRPDAAVDTDLSTGWVASGLDRSPWLEVSWPRARRVDGLQLLSDQYLAASRPRSVTVQFDSGEVAAAAVDGQGYVRFPARTTRTLDIGFTKVTAVTNFDRATGLQQTLPVGVSEVRVLGADDLRKPVNPAQQTGVPCGFGPTLVADGRSIPTRVEGTIKDVLHHQPLRWVACGSNAKGEVAGTVGLAAGPHAVSAGATGEFEPLQISFTTPREGEGKPTPLVAASLLRPDPGTMRITVGPRSQESVLTVAQNFNEGWTARDGQGTELAPIRLDGWKQGWVLRGGPATVVTARFTPDGWYRAGLLVGLLALLCTAALVPLSRRRPSGLAERPAPGEAKFPVVVVIAGGVVSLVFMSGWAGMVAGIVAGLVVLGLNGVLPGFKRSPGAYLPALVFALGLVAGALAASQPWLQGSAGLHSIAVQGLTLLAFTLACAAALGNEVSGGSSVDGGETSKRRSRRPRRMMGRSTRR